VGLLLIFQNSYKEIEIFLSDSEFPKKIAKNPLKTGFVSETTEQL